LGVSLDEHPDDRLARLAASKEPNETTDTKDSEDFTPHSVVRGR
jgi:hypothetical protein